MNQPISGGDVFAEVDESDLMRHQIMLPPNEQGIITFIAPAGSYNLTVPPPSASAPRTPACVRVAVVTDSRQRTIPRMSIRCPRVEYCRGFKGRQLSLQNEFFVWAGYECGVSCSAAAASARASHLFRSLAHARGLAPLSAKSAGDHHADGGH